MNIRILPALAGNALVWAGVAYAIWRTPVAACLAWALVLSFTAVLTGRLHEVAQ